MSPLILTLIRNKPSTRVLNRAIAWLGMCALLLSSLLQPATAHAQSVPTDAATAAGLAAGLQVEDRDGTLHLQWQGTVSAAATGEIAGPTASYGGYLLPMQTVMIELSGDQTGATAMAAVAVQGMSSSPYTGDLTPAPVHAPPALDYVPTPTNTPYVEPELPSSPIFVMSEGWQRNRHLAVLGFSPIYQDPNTGEVLAVESLAATVASASIASTDALLNEVTADPNNSELFAPLATQATAPGPTNPLANTNAYKLFVNQIGIQQITGKQLADAGLASPKASKVRVFYLGQELPLHIIDSNSNDVLNADDYLRFYAPAAGDALNAESVYWLAVGATDGLRMSQRAVAAAGATKRNTAYEVGRFQDNSHYTTELAGADGDNWFQADLRAESSDASLEINLPHQLPLSSAVPATTTLTLNLTPYSIGLYGSAVNHSLKVNNGGFNVTDSWNASFSGPRPYQDIVRTITLAKAADTWTITLLQGGNGRAIKLDAIDYLLPVQLNFGGKGAVFQGAEGDWRYQLTNTPTSLTGGRALYDITDPTQPQRLTIPGGANFDIQDGPDAHRYLMLGESTFFVPNIQAHSAVNLGGKSAAHTIYIAPAAFHATLQPLVDLRKSQGYQVRVIDAQAIYDAWSYGMVDPKAIRSLLRFAAGNWSPAPIAAVLVGDATSDPLNYLGDGNPNVIPAYIVDEDPWIKYVACESCFGQLDGDDPAEDFLVDIWIGRFPVIDEAELTTVVTKIVNYETNTDEHALWRSASLQIADDDVRPDNTVDDAGPFVGSAEHVISLMPAELRHLRNYFSAATDFSNAPVSLQTVLNTIKAWFISDADDALQRSVDLMNSGVGMVTYTGHSNHWQWARIVKDGDENRWMFGLVEVTFLRNFNSPFIAMSMTCYTSQFVQTAARHFTLDERLFLHGGGGAISTWGPTGFSIVPAHDVLQEGFHALLWKSPPLQAKLGALTKAGYQEVFSTGRNFDVNKTFAVFGDPLTSARVTEMDAIFMPKLNR